MHLFVAIPALNELDYLPKTLQALERQQTTVPFSVYVCVNQLDSWWEQDDKKSICDNNRQLLFKLRRRHFAFPLHIIDKSSPGKGWDNKNFGVGWARKTLFDHIMNIAEPEDVMVSMDADTVFGEQYLDSIARNFAVHPQQQVVSVPYYHPLTDDDTANRANLPENRKDDNFENQVYYFRRSCDKRSRNYGSFFYRYRFCHRGKNHSIAENQRHYPHEKR